MLFRTVPLLIVLAACGSPPDAAATDADTDGGSDSGGTVERVDTGLALVYHEGEATYDATSWTGEESMVATSYDGAVEHCRITNPTTGTPAAAECPECSFAFDLVFGAGTAEGEACANLKFTADQLDGLGLSYGFAPVWTDPTSGYTYDDVLLFGYEGADGFTWVPWGIAEITEQDARIVYEATYDDLYYYYYL